MKNYLIIVLMLQTVSVFAQNYPNNFTLVWQDRPWESGGVTPTGAVWSLDGMFDFDGDGQGEFFLSSAWSGSFGNDAMLYEAAGDTFRIIWYDWANDLDLNLDNFSAITSGDLDTDGNPELILLNDCLAGQDGLLIFEYDPALGSFPAIPTTTWNINLPGGVEEAGDIAVTNLDTDARPELLMSVFSRNPAASHVIIAELMPGSDVGNPVWHVEMDDDSTLAFYSYNVQATDLDQDGAREIIAVEWNYNRMVFWENSSEDQYARVNDLFVTLLPNSFSNEGLAEADFDGNGLNELYLASTAGFFWVVTNNGDISQMNYADNFHLLGDYRTFGGFSLTQLKIGNADSPSNQTPDGPDIYLCGTDTTGVESAVFDWEYRGGDVTDFNSYQISTIYPQTNSGNGLFKPSKLGFGDTNGDNLPEMVIASFSLDTPRPHIVVLQSDGQTGLDEPPGIQPEGFILAQNYPNPFNPVTTIRYQVPLKSAVTLTVFNTLGRLIKTLVQTVQPAGTYEIHWDGRDDHHLPMTSGVYFYKLSAGNFTETRKMILLR